MKNFLLLKSRIKKNEGFRNIAYSDVLGFKTIGFGHLIKKDEKHLLNKKQNKKYLENIFELDFAQAFNDFKAVYKKDKYPKNTQEVLIEMIFQLGIKNQKKFIKMNKYLKKNQLFMAALEMKKSLWYKQTPKRVNMLIKLLLKKKYEK